MQVQSLNNAGFGHAGRLSGDEARRYYENSLLSLSDRDIRNLALADASYRVNDKGYRRRHNALLLSLPLLYGARDALFVNPKILNSKLTGPAARAAVGASTAAGWLGVMAVAGGVFGLANLMARKNDTVGDFNRNHPVLYTLTTLGAAVGAWIGVNSGISKLIDRVSDAKKAKLSKKIDNLGEKFNANKWVKKVQNGVRKFAKNGSEGMKTAAKYTAWYLPAVAFWTVLLSPIAHNMKKSRVAENTASQLREAQKEVIASRMAEAYNV